MILTTIGFPTRISNLDVFSDFVLSDWGSEFEIAAVLILAFPIDSTNVILGLKQSEQLGVLHKLLGF